MATSAGWQALLAAPLVLAACHATDSVPVPPPIEAPLVAVSAGVLHSCGVAVTSRVYCWGWNRDGEIGDGTKTDRPYPVRVLGNAAFTEVRPGGGHTCALAAGGAPQCWGYNLSGQLGDNSNTTRVVPVAVAGTLVLRAVEAGGAYTCAAAADSTAYCWGWNGAGQLGDGTRTDRNGPGAVVAGGHKLVAISAGTQHSCALAADSTAYCWGRNDVGQLGDSTQSDTTLPVAVGGGLKFVAVTVGFLHSCGLAPGGAAYCWGDNSWTQLGDTLQSFAVSPIPVNGGFTFRSLSAGASHTCGVEPSGTARCWGLDVNGQLGSAATHVCVNASGSGPCTPLPAAVAGGLAFDSISAGTQHTCGLTTSRVAYCWGLNSNGQLGDGTRNSTGAPVRVALQP